jgi:putative addiction module component (TIGR02574 family)
MTGFEEIRVAALALTPVEKGRLVDELIGQLSQPGTIALSEAETWAEIDRREADAELNPDDEVPWEQVMAESLEDIRRCRSK